jgi:hypothetical protein
MNGFFTNLVDRHLGTCDTIQPRTLGRFETDRGSMPAVSADQGTAPVVSENDQTLQTPSEFTVESPPVANYKPGPIENRNDVPSPGEFSVDAPPVANYKPGSIENRNDVPSPGEFSVESRPVANYKPGPIENRNDVPSPGEFTVDSPTVANHKPDPIENRNNVPSPSRPDQNNSPTKSVLTEDNTAHFDSHVLPRKPQDTPSLVADVQSSQVTVKRDQPDKAVRVDDRKHFTDNHLNTNIKKLDEVIREKTPLPTLGEVILENALNHRIYTILERLTNDPLSPTTPPDQDNLSSQNNEIQMSILPGTEVPLSDSAISSLDMAPAPSRRAAREETRSPKDRVNTVHGQLEPPSWLLDMESQFNQHSQQKEIQAEPVINVTIGRVEVRAVQTETPNNAHKTKKPTGVMTLDDYLKRRENRGSR